ncbi:ABC transporter permease [Paenibacillus donghaensis]|uniref:ABC3 transporter permease C-terminal domain-containing protein n=1 Tax=Paenibacillus donghaensis TaxID=414771 RepID=A0A2Z2KTI4_9BACL|nr:FtsX-like permease family protein [Paenibacillus donghaensis]ASA24091.1 hypothetical protein B9T62_26895 [Paenibacillus donghaensis]
MKNTVSIRDIALSTLRFHKGRTLLTIGTAAISVALILIVLTYLHSEDQRSKRAAINEIGAYHVQYEQLSKEQQQEIAGNTLMKTTYLSYNNKNVLCTSLSSLHIDMAIGYMEGVNDGLIALRQGRAPAADNEIVLDDWVVEALGYAPKLGQIIPLDFEITQQGKTAKMKETFKLVGITEDIAVRKAARAGLMFISKERSLQYNPEPEVTLFSLLKSDFNATAAAQKIGADAGLKEEQIKLNERYTGAYEQNPTSILQGGFVLLIIVLSAGMVIYNIFNIYISQQIRLFGTMKAIGMTPRQLRRMIQLEGLLISLTGSVAGILLGIGGSLAFIPFLGKTAGADSSLYVEISLNSVGAAFLLGILLVAFSIQVPASRVGRISEIAAIRFNPAAGAGASTKQKRNRLPHSLGSFTLISAQLLRHRKRTWVTVTSITLTGLIFVISGSVLDSISIGNIAGSMVPGDYKLSAVSSLRMDAQTDLLNETVIEQIQSIKGVQTVFTEMYDGLIYNKQDAQKHIKEPDKVKHPYIDTEMYGYDDALMDKTLRALGQSAPTLEQMKAGNYLIAIAEEGTYHAGDRIRMAPFGEGQKELEFTILGVLPTYITYKGDSAEGGTLLAHRSMFERLGMDQRIKQISVIADPEQKVQVEQQLRTIAAADRRLEFTSFQDIYQEFSAAKRVMELAAYGFITALLVISIFNLVNSNLTSMLFRKREISLLEAIGLSRRQLTLQLSSEGWVVIAFSLGLISIVGIPAGYLGVALYRREATFAQYQFPLGALLTLITAYALVQVLTTLYMLHKFHKESLMERIRCSE